MVTKLDKKSILKKTAQVGASLLLSKFLGIFREIVQVHYLGIGQLSDAFAIAYQIPNLLRRVFAEGALSAAFIPTLVSVAQADACDHGHQASRLVTLTLAVIGTIVFVLCLFVVYSPEKVILLFAPGFADKPTELMLATPLVRILIFFIFFISSSALFAGALQAKHHFTVPSWSAVLLNIVYIAGLGICSHLSLSVAFFAFFILLGGLLQLALHIYIYKIGF
jgi:putative peptidoglycan lipid II flippase